MGTRGPGSCTAKPAGSLQQVIPGLCLSLPICIMRGELHPHKFEHHPLLQPDFPLFPQMAQAQSSPLGTGGGLSDRQLG